MSSTRQQIVDALETVFKTITTANGYTLQIGSKVYPWRKTPLSITDLPAICFWDGEADVNRETLEGTTSHRLHVTAALFCESKTTASQARAGINDMFKALNTDSTFGGLVQVFWPTSHDITMEVDGDICGAGRIEFALTYYTATPGEI